MITITLVDKESGLANRTFVDEEPGILVLGNRYFYRTGRRDADGVMRYEFVTSRA